MLRRLVFFPSFFQAVCIPLFIVVPFWTENCSFPSAFWALRSLFISLNRLESFSDHRFPASHSDLPLSRPLLQLAGSSDILPAYGFLVWKCRKISGRTRIRCLLTVPDIHLTRNSKTRRSGHCNCLPDGLYRLAKWRGTRFQIGWFFFSFYPQSCPENADKCILGKGNIRIPT